MYKKKAIIGIHDDTYRHTIKRFLTMNEFEVTATREVNDMIGYLKTNSYNAVIMDLNLGKPGTVWIEPAKKVFPLIGDAKYIGISGNLDTLKLAKNESIPATDTSDLVDEITKLE